MYIDENGLRVNSFDADIARAVPQGDQGSVPMNQIFPQFGEDEPWLPDLEAFSMAGEAFEPGQAGGVRAIIVTPAAVDNADAYKYPREVQRLRDMLAKYDGADTPIQSFIYTKTNAFQSNDQYTSTGKVLFQYDPAEAVVVEDIEYKYIEDDEEKVITMRCPVQYEGFKLWIDHPISLGASAWDPFYEDNWAGSVPYVQPAGDTHLISRDDLPAACVVVADAASTSLSATASVSLTPLTTFSTVLVTSTSAAEASYTVYTGIVDGITTLLTYGIASSTSSELPPSTTSSVNAATTSAETIVEVLEGTSIVATLTTNVASSATSPPSTTFSYLPEAQYLGECYKDVSRDAYGQCQWEGKNGIVSTGACPSDAACSSNGASCSSGSDSGSVSCT